MSDLNQIELNGKFFTFQWILGNYKDLASKGLSPNEIRTLAFCGQWLAGQKTFVVKTSGSTGEPKSIALTRQQMVASARMTREALHLSKGDRALVCLSPDHIAGLMMLVRGIELELNLTVVEPAGNPFSLVNFQENKQFDFTALVPFQLQTVLSSGRTNLAVLNKMKAILVGGAQVSRDLQKAVARVKAPIYQTFGMTESVSHVALRRLNGPDKSELYEALAGVELGQDERGCLTIKSRVTNDERLVTNDLVEVKSEKQFVWLGRIDNVINSGGVKVQAEKVEKAISEAIFEMNQGKSANHSFFVGALPDKTYGEVVAVVFEGIKQLQIDEKKIREILTGKLARFEIPRSFYFLNAFTRRSNGKIDRKANLAAIVNK